MRTTFALGAVIALLAPPLAAGIRFTDITLPSGLSARHHNGMSGELYFVEMMGPGVGLVDIDGDGDLDIVVPQGHLLERDPEVRRGTTPLDMVWRNELDRSKGRNEARFVDVSAAAGLETHSQAEYGYGVAAGDYDNDGKVDLVVLNWTGVRLYRNSGGGRFSDVTEAVGIDESGWAVGASFFDADRDGWLDLYVVKYVQFDLRQPGKCFSPDSARDYCGPSSFRPEVDTFLRNVDGRRFVRKSLGQAANGLGVVAHDANGDGWPDLYVANDQQENQSWINEAGRGFVDEAVLSGLAVSLEGKAQASMGVTAGDYDADGDEDLFVTHLAGETNTLYRNRGDGNYDDATLGSGLGPPSWASTGFGTGFVDFDADNHLDIFVVNGAVTVIRDQAEAGSRLPLAQIPQVFRNLGNSRFELVGASPGSPLSVAVVGRGAAFGDIDNDGDVDVVVAANNGAVRVLRNDSPRVLPDWIGLRLVTRTGRDAYGARVEVTFDSARAGAGGASRVVRVVRADGSYASSSDPRIVIAVPSGQAPVEVEVAWPDSTRECFANIEVNRYQTLRLGSAPPQGRVCR